MSSIAEKVTLIELHPAEAESIADGETVLVEDDEFGDVRAIVRVE